MQIATVEGKYSTLLEERNVPDIPSGHWANMEEKEQRKGKNKKRSLARLEPFYRKWTMSLLIRLIDTLNVKIRATIIKKKSSGTACKDYKIQIQNIVRLNWSFYSAN